MNKKKGGTDDVENQHKSIKKIISEFLVNARNFKRLFLYVFCIFLSFLIAIIAISIWNKRYKEYPVVTSGIGALYFFSLFFTFVYLFTKDGSEWMHYSHLFITFTVACVAASLTANY